MSKIPCRKCKSCGIYNDISVLECECGFSLQAIPAVLMEVDEIPCEAYGEISKEITCFVQKCSACGALNFTNDKDAPVKVCHNCHKTRVAATTPVEFTTEEAPVEEPAAGPAAPDKKNQDCTPDTPPRVSFKAGFTAEEDDDDDSNPWGGILGNIKKAVGTLPAEDEQPASHREAAHPYQTDSDEDEDDDVADWSGILGGKVKVESPKRRPDITLSAIRFGQLTFTLSAEPNRTYLLGRSALQGTFLCQDTRVSNEHCVLFFQNGNWYVRDNHSSNGTAINSRDIGLNGEHILSNGDELKLGHHPDSMAFRITIV